MRLVFLNIVVQGKRGLGLVIQLLLLNREGSKESFQNT